MFPFKALYVARRLRYKRDLAHSLVLQANNLFLTFPHTFFSYCAKIIKRYNKANAFVTNNLGNHSYVSAIDVRKNKVK